MKFFLLILKNLRRNLLRTILTAIGTMVLVVIVTLVWSILYFLDNATAEKSKNLKGIVTERWQIPSQMPFAYAASLEEGAARNPGDIRPADSMTWQFYGGTIEKEVRTRESFIFAFALDADKLATMMDDLEDLTGDERQQLLENIKKLKSNRKGIIVGRDRLAALQKRVGDTMTIYGINYKDINLEFDIVAELPPGRYDNSAAMNREYLNEALDNYPRTHRGEKHPMAAKTLNLVWLRVPDKDSFDKLADQLVSSPLYSNPAVKMETQSSGIAAFLEAYSSLIKGMRWLLAPAILATLSLVIANAISISVRERRMEMAVLKVLGFRPGHLFALVLGEAILIGVVAGVTSAGLTYLVVNDLLGGIKFPIGFFPAFFIPLQAIWWGMAIGIGTALVGSVVPAWTARTVRVSEVFARVA